MKFYAAIIYLVILSISPTAMSITSVLETNVGQPLIKWLGKSNAESYWLGASILTNDYVTIGAEYFYAQGADEGSYSATGSVGTAIREVEILSERYGLLISGYLNGVAADGIYGTIFSGHLQRTINGSFGDSTVQQSGYTGYELGYQFIFIKFLTLKTSFTSTFHKLPTDTKFSGSSYSESFSHKKQNDSAIKVSLGFLF